MQFSQISTVILPAFSGDKRRNGIKIPVALLCWN